MVKNVSKRKTDNTLTLKTFSDLKLSLSAKNIFLVEKIHNINIVFFFLLDLLCDFYYKYRSYNVSETHFYDCTVLIIEIFWKISNQYL